MIYNVVILNNRHTKNICQKCKKMHIADLFQHIFGESERDFSDIV